MITKLTINLFPVGVHANRRLKIPNQKIHLRALDLYGTLKIDFEDCLSVAYMAQQGLEDIYSYDQDFDGVASVNRIEP